MTPGSRHTVTDAVGPGAVPTYRSVLANRELQVLLLASLVSSAGDVLARFALGYLVFTKTDSPFLSAAAFAVTFLSGFIGGPLFAGWTDRAPARRVMIVTDVVRGGGLLLMTALGGPLWLLVLLLFLITSLESPFDGARSVLFPDVVGTEAYPRALVVDRIVYQAAQVVGFGAGGAAVALVGARVALGLDAASFILSAGLLLGLVRQRDAVETEPRLHSGLRQVAADAAIGWRTVLRTAPLRRVSLLAWLAAGLAIAPEGLVIPLSRELGSTEAQGSLMLLSAPVGYIVSALVIAARPADAQRRLLAPLALLATAPFALFVLKPPLAVGVGVFGLTGVGLSFVIIARTEIVRLAPASQRGRVASTVGSALLVLQGVGTVAGGLLADVVGAANTVGLVGASLGVLVLVTAALGGRE